MQHFSPRDFQGDTQCWSITQDHRGVVYVGNLGTALEYDGTSWRKISIPQGKLITAFACEPAHDTIFAGARGDLGYLELLPDGTRQYVSLSDQLPPELRDVGFVSNVYSNPDGAFFVGATQVMRWRDGHFKVWPLETEGKLTSAWVEGHLYVHNPRTGLLRLDGDAFVPVSDDPLFHRASVRAILSMADGPLLIGTYHEGAYTLRRDGVVAPWQSECNDFLKAKGIYRMMRLRDGSLAIATDTAGLLLLDQEGHFRNRVDGTGGLHGSDILCLYQDAEGGLWIGLENGCTRAEVCSPLSILRGRPEDSLTNASGAGEWFGTTVLANANGLYQVVPPEPRAFAGPRLRRLPDITDYFTSLCGVENGLLTVGGGKIALLDADGKLVPIQGEITAARNVLASRVVPGCVYVTDEAGHVTKLRLDPGVGRWVVDKVIASLGKPGETSIVESANGDLWLGTKEHGLFRVHWGPDGVAAVTSFLDRPGPLHGETFVLSHSNGGPVGFHTHHRLYQLDAAGQNVLPVEGYPPPVNDGTLEYVMVTQFDSGNLWLTSKHTGDPEGRIVGGEAIAGGPGRAPMFRALPHKVQDVVGEIEAFLPTDPATTPPTTLLLPGIQGNGVVRLDVRQWEKQPEARPFQTVIRRATSVGSSRTGRHHIPILHDALNYQQNSVNFEFAANTLAFGATPVFQTRLVNLGSGDWSDFNGRFEADYVNLPEGNYTFEARARNADGQLGSVASLSFRILPPWQRTPWAYLAYLLALALALWELVRWRGQQLQRRNAVLNALVDARTSELRGRESELVRARDDAEAANRAKSAFLANMSHELRTPLNAILGYSQIMLKQDDLSARGREQVAVIGQSGGHLLALINEVLDLSKIEAGKLTLSPHDTSLPQLLDEVGAAFRPRFAEKGLTFTEARAPGLPITVHTDPSRLRQVLFNLLSNSVKFTPKGNVSLDVRPTEPGWVRFAVSDTGIGIATDALDDIFLAFHQASESVLSAQGTGLGLAISQRLVGLLGGRIKVESTLGQGSRFWVDLPLPQVESLGGKRPAAPALDRVTGYEGPPRSLLLVDDLAENRRVLRDFLQPLGFEIEEAVDGEDCLRPRARQPDAVLLDLRLGALDGFEVARILRSRTKGVPLGIIAISASVFESDRQRALDAGCDDFLPKPFEEAQLLAALERVLGLQWVQSAAPVPPSDDPAHDEPALPPEEIDALLELSLRGDIVGIRKRIDSLRAAGTSGGAEAFARRLAPLIDAYQMEAIHALLLSLRIHGGN